MSDAPTATTRLRLAPGLSYQVMGAAGVDVFVRGRTMRITLPLFRVLLEFAEPELPAAVQARLCGVPPATFDELVRQLVAGGILIPENSIEDAQNITSNRSFASLIRGDLLRDESFGAALRAQLESGRAVVIRDAIDPQFAERVHGELAASTAWKPYELVTPLFHYHHHNLYAENEFPPALKECKTIFEAPATRALMARLSGRDCAGKLILGASLYLPGDHSLPHRDYGLERSVAFVWNLTRDWESRWGGHLYWMPSGTSVAPMFNCLTLFNVMESSLHLVTAVSPHARGRRLAVSGWWTGVAALGAAPQPGVSDEAANGVSAARYGQPHTTLTPDGRVVAI